MELPRTSPSGRNPASLTSRNSLTDRSEVKIDPACPGRSSASRAMASCGTPSAAKSAPCCSLFWSVIVLLRKLKARDAGARALKPDPGRLAALRVEGHDGQAAWPRRVPPGAEVGDSGAGGGHLGDVVLAAFLHGAFAVADAQFHRGDHDALRALPGHVAIQLDPAVVPGLVDQVGMAGHLGVARPPAGLVQ